MINIPLLSRTSNKVLFENKLTKFTTFKDVSISKLHIVSCIIPPPINHLTEQEGQYNLTIIYIVSLKAIF